MRGSCEYSGHGIYKEGGVELRGSWILFDPSNVLSSSKRGRLYISVHNFWWLQNNWMLLIFFEEIVSGFGTKTRSKTWSQNRIKDWQIAEIAVGRTKGPYRTADNHWVTSDAWRTHTRTSEGNVSKHLWSLTSFGHTIPLYRTSDKRCCTSDAKHWSIGRPKEMKKDLQVYFRTYTVEGPDVLRIARNHLEPTVFVRTQKIRVPDVRHYQRLVDLPAAFYPLTALIEEFFGPL